MKEFQAQMGSCAKGHDLHERHLTAIMSVLVPCVSIWAALVQSEHNVEKWKINILHKAHMTSVNLP